MKTALIVGASRGLGHALAEEYAKRGWHVFATVRNLATAKAIKPGSGEVTVLTLDTTDRARIDALRKGLAGQTVDLLFVNAAVADDRGSIGDVDVATFERMMVTNALAPLCLIDRLAHLVPPDGIAAVMSSSMGSIAGNDQGGLEVYRMTKAALNMGLKSLAVRRSSEGRTYIAADPGWVRTDMGGEGAPLAISESIPALVNSLESRRGVGGVAFVNYQNRDIPW